ncbi:MAG TPA: acyltransferase domain-containing protein, partial [Polyangiaceae bacterium]|nr:acyltransferase domain-containing protein [Polyangiaceae bacterium]
MYVDERTPAPREPARSAPEAAPSAPATPVAPAMPAPAAPVAPATPAVAPADGAFARAALTSPKPTDAAAHVNPSPGVVFVFSGIGSQWAGMGRSLYASEPVFRATIDACDEHVRAYAGWSLVEVLTVPARE